MAKVSLKTVIRDTSPVMAGYVVLGMGFGMLMESKGYGILWAAAMSLFIYAGSMQYAAVGLFLDGASAIAVALTTLAVNARHLFYGISMVDRYKGTGAKKPYLMFALTDETYSLVCTGEKGADYCFLVSMFDQCYWIIGTVIGSLLGNVIPFSTDGIEFSLTALFLTVMTDQWLKGSLREHISAAAGVIISVACLLIFKRDNFLIPSMIGIAAFLLIMMVKEKRHDH